MNSFKSGLTRVKAFAFDVDGVFSSVKVIMHPMGEPMRTMNIRDGYAIQLAVKKGFPIAIITGGRSNAIKKRFRYLGVKDIYLNARHKISTFQKFLAKYSLDARDVLFMGDDLPDYDIMKSVGFPVCPTDAAEEIKALAKYISPKEGGNGCVRDIVEQTLKLQGKWMDDDAFSW